MKTFYRTLVSLLAFPTLACAQSVQQSGTITPGHASYWITNGVIADAGTAANGKLTSLGITANGGPSLCINSAPSTVAHNSMCFGVSTAAAATISLQNYLGAAPQVFNFIINGTTYTFPFSVGGILGPNTSTVGHLAVWNNTAGSLLADSTTLPPLTGYISLLSNPSLATSPTGNPTGGVILPTYSSTLIQATTSNVNNREFLVNLGLESTNGAGVANNNGDKVTLYSGITAGTNSGQFWSLNLVCIAQADLVNKVNGNCNETDINNNSAFHYKDLSPAIWGTATTGAGTHQATGAFLATGLTPPINVTAVAAGAAKGGGGNLIRLTVDSTATLETGFRTQVSGVGSNADNIWTLNVIDGTHIDLQNSTFTSGYSTGVIFGPVWRYGMVIAGNTANEAGIWELSGAKAAILIGGDHDVGIDMRATGFGVAAIILSNLSSYAALEMDNTTVANLLYLDASNVTQLGGGLAANVNSDFTVRPGASQQFIVGTKLNLTTGITIFSDDAAGSPSLQGMEFGGSQFRFSGGNVGIAKTPGAYPLDVNGIINAGAGYAVNGVNGVSCGPGAPTGSFTVVAGMVTVC